MNRNTRIVRVVTVVLLVALGVWLVTATEWVEHGVAHGLIAGKADGPSGRVGHPGDEPVENPRGGTSFEEGHHLERPPLGSRRHPPNPALR